MITIHVISDETLNNIEFELSRNNHWLAINKSQYFLEKEDVLFFRNSNEAHDFINNSILTHDGFKVIYADSVADVFRQIPYEESLNEQIINSTNKKSIIMNEKNLDYLVNQMKFTGFGEGHRDELKEKMEKQEPRITIFHQADFGKDKTVATLQLNKSEESDMYFFNRYSLMVKTSQNPDPVKQTFYINNNQSNITLKEAYNLMSGRAVHKEITPKEGEKYQAWLQLDFKETDKNNNYKVKQYHQNYGFDLEATLAKHPIKELGNEIDKAQLIESLQRGNRQSVTFLQNEKEQKVFIEASPQFKSLNFYDSNMQRIKAENLYEKKMPEQSEKQSSKQEMKQGKGENFNDDEQMPAQKKPKRKQKISA